MNNTIDSPEAMHIHRVYFVQYGSKRLETERYFLDLGQAEWYFDQLEEAYKAIDYAGLIDDKNHSVIEPVIIWDWHGIDSYRSERLHPSPVYDEDFAEHASAIADAVNKGGFDEAVKVAKTFVGGED